MFALNPYPKQLWKVPQTPFISSSQHKYLACIWRERTQAAPPGYSLMLHTWLAYLIRFLSSFSSSALSLLPCINASLRLALSCAEWAEQVSSRISGRKESSEIMTGTLHKVEIGKKSREEERWKILHILYVMEVNKSILAASETSWCWKTLRPKWDEMFPISKPCWGDALTISHTCI